MQDTGAGMVLEPDEPAGPTNATDSYLNDLIASQAQAAPTVMSGIPGPAMPSQGALPAHWAGGQLTAHLENSLGLDRDQAAQIAGLVGVVARQYAQEMAAPAQAGLAASQADRNLGFISAPDADGNELPMDALREVMAAVPPELAGDPRVASVLRSAAWGIAHLRRYGGRDRVEHELSRRYGSDRVAAAAAKYQPGRYQCVDPHEE